MPLRPSPVTGIHRCSIDDCGIDLNLLLLLEPCLKHQCWTSLNISWAYIFRFSGTSWDVSSVYLESSFYVKCNTNFSQIIIFIGWQKCRTLISHLTIVGFFYIMSALDFFPNQRGLIFSGQLPMAALPSSDLRLLQLVTKFLVPAVRVPGAADPRLHQAQSSDICWWPVPTSMTACCEPEQQAEELGSHAWVLTRHPQACHPQRLND